MCELTIDQARLAPIELKRYKLHWHCADGSGRSWSVAECANLAKAEHHFAVYYAPYHLVLDAVEAL
jgi:hypothetical protein